jgi:hypothetical protein
MNEEREKRKMRNKMANKQTVPRNMNEAPEESKIN